jgi:Na+-driven multidrug efflux pump
MLGSTDTIAPYAKAYLNNIMFVAPFCSSSFTLNNMLRYEGKAKLGMVGLLTGGILNIGGDALFIFGMKMGIAGAGLSTAISQVISFTLLLYMFLSGKTESKLSLRNISFEGKMIFDIIGIGFPSLLRQGLGSFATILVNFKAAEYAGDAGVSAMTIVTRVSFFLFAIALGIGQGFQPVCAFNYEVKKYDRVKKGLVFTILFGIVLVSFLAIPGIVFPEGIMWLFNHDNKVIEAGTLALRIGCIGVLFLPISIAANMLYQCIRKSEIASFLAMLRSGLVFIPVLIIFEASFKLVGIQISQPVADVISALISLPFIIIFIIKNHENSEKENEKQVESD